jgi:hypothetical protein
MGSEQDTEPAPGAAATEGGFSLELSEDLRDTRGWVHDFAAGVIRPAGSEWDEREETPWPILEEASKIGLYSLDFFAQQAFEPSGLGIVVAFEELFWGDAGIALSLVGSSLAAVSLVSNGTNEQIGEWAPQMFGVPGDVKLAAFCSSEPDAGSDVGAIRTRAVYDEAKDEWVLNGIKTWATNGGIANVHIIVASVASGLDGPAEQAVQQRRRIDVQAGRGGGGGPRHRAGHPDPGRERLHPGVPGRALAPRREDLHDLRGHQRDPAHDHRPRRHRPPRPVTLTTLTCRPGGIRCRGPAGQPSRAYPCR